MTEPRGDGSDELVDPGDDRPDEAEAQSQAEQADGDAGHHEDAVPFHEPEPDTAAYVVHPSVLTSATIAVGAAATLVLGVIPGPVLNLAGLAGQFLR